MNAVKIEPERLKSARINADMTQAQLAARSGVSQSTISRLERGVDIAHGFSDTHAALAKALRVSVTDLYGHSPSGDAGIPEPAPSRSDTVKRMGIAYAEGPDRDIAQALLVAFDKARHTIDDVLAAQDLLASAAAASRGIDLAQTAARLLDAAASLRALGIAPTSSAVAVRLAAQPHP